MDHEFAFISSEDHDDYNRLNGGIRRSIVQVPVSPGGVSKNGDHQPQTRELVAGIRSDLDKIFESFAGKLSTKIERNWFSCDCIEVKADDGMSWSAEAVSLALKVSYSRFDHWHLTSSRNTDSPPAVADFIGLGTFLRLAGKHKLGSVLITGRSWLTWGIVCLTAMMAVAVALFDYLVKSSLTSKPYYFVVASALLGLAVKYFAPYVAIKTFPEKLKSFNDTLEKVFGQGEEGTTLSTEELPPNYQEFIEGLALHLAGNQFPRYVIADGYGNQDPTTRRVIRRYFDEYAERATGGEFWVVFDGRRGDKFSALIRNRQRFYGYTKSKVFQQVFISDNEKRQLIEQQKLPQTAFDFRAIKLIRKSEETDRGVERVKKVLDDYRKEHNKTSRYGDLEFLYLLSLTAAKPSSFVFGYESLKSKLAQKNRTRSDVLRQFLEGSKLIKSEFEARLKGIEGEFKSLLEIKGDDREKALHVNQEAALALERSASSWGLPPLGLGHLYWSLYWLDDRTGKSVEAIWTEKLSDHLMLADSGAVDSQQLSDARTKVMISEELFNGALNTATGCLKTCVFEKVPGLLRKAFDLIDGGELTNNPTRQERIIKKCWEAYSLLGEDEILEVLLDLYEASTRQTPTEPPDDVLAKLFFQSIPLTSSTRSTFGAEFFNWIGWSRPALESIAQYAQARSAWLAFTISPSIRLLNGTELSRAINYSDQVLDDLTQNALERVKSTSEEYLRITDILTVSIAIWCNALRLRPEMQAISATSPLDNIYLLLDFAASAVLRAAEIREKSNVNSPRADGIDFLSSGLARELYSMSLASVLLACHYLPQDQINERIIKEVNDIVSFSEELMDSKLKPVDSKEDLFSDGLLKQVDQILTFCEILWESFGFHRLRYFINIRRIHFNAITQRSRYGKKVADEVIRESIDTTLREHNFTGLIANLVIADCLRQVGDFEAHYLRTAGNIALKGGFDPRLKHELSLAVIIETHHLRHDPTDFIEDLLEEDENHRSFLLAFLEGIEKESVDSWVLAIHNISVSIKRPELRLKLKKTISAFVSSIKWPEVREIVDQSLGFYAVQEKLMEKEPVNSTETLKAWQNQKASPFYPGVLDLLLGNNSHDTEVLKESASILEHRPPDSYSFSLLLAYHVLVSAYSSKQTDSLNLDGPLTFLREGINRWEGEMSTETTLGIYGILSQMDEDLYRVHHFQKFEEWTHNKLLNAHLELLTSLVGQGQYFLIFSDYYRTMMFWGLMVERVDKVVPGQQRRTEELTAIISELRDGTREPPAPLVESSVSADFLEIGGYLFSEPSIQDQTLDEARAKFNQAAGEIMPKLLSIIIGLNTLPTSIKELLRAYSERFFQFVQA